VSSAGLRITVQPAASAGAIFQIAMTSGKFHGMICPTTPTGWRMVCEVKLRPGT
jgi:formylmethanofuran dehydrogenase subunit E